MKITFLGTAGGRFVVLNQLRASGGWILEMDKEMLHIDPGPGALVRAKEYGVRLRKLTGILVSHPHPDHCTDLNVVIEAMTNGATKKRGVLVANEYVIKGGEKYTPAVSPYHLDALERYEILKAGEKTKIGGIEVKTTPTRHSRDGEHHFCMGFVLRGSETIGYTSDGEYFEGMEKHFTGCRYLVLNCLRPRGDALPFHMNSEHASKLIGMVKPETAILQHFGIKMLRGVAEREVQWIQKQTGVKTIAARDGMKLDPVV